MFFTIEIDDNDRKDSPETPWNAALFAVDEDGRSGDVMAVGFGATVRDALEHLLEDVSDAEIAEVATQD